MIRENQSDQMKRQASKMVQNQVQKDITGSGDINEIQQVSDTNEHLI